MSTTLSASTLLAVPLAPLAGAALAGILGTTFGGNVIGRRASHTLTILGVLIAFILSAMTLKSVAVDGARFNETIYEWMKVGGLKMEIGFMVDGLTAMMMCVVTFVSLMVHIYTIGYMEEDAGYNRFFAYISLFTFSMLMLVMSNNLLQLFFGWEAVGLVSYLLIGFWFNKPTAIFANMKAFLVNRVGDFGFILGIGLIVAYAGSLNYTEVFAKAPGMRWPHAGLSRHRLDVDHGDLHLPVHRRDGQVGPVPAARLAARFDGRSDPDLGPDPRRHHGDGRYLHGGTHVAAVRIVGHRAQLHHGDRCHHRAVHGLPGHHPERHQARCCVLHAVTAGLHDGRARCARPTAVAVFHLMTHAFFKALLFLAAGSVIIGMHHNQDIRWMGGLRKYMPITWITSLLGSLALIGTPLFAGFYSKDSIIEAVHFSNLPASGFAYFAVLAGVFVTSFYSFRLYFLVFHGKERYDQNPDAHHGHDDHHDEHGHGHDEHKPHESPWVVTVPLLLLAIPSVVIGFMTIQPMLFGEFLKDAIRINGAELHPAMEKFCRRVPRSVGHGTARAVHGTVLPGAGRCRDRLVSCGSIWSSRPCRPPSVVRLKPIVTILENKYYLDWFNENVLARGARALGTGLWKGGDQGADRRRRGQWQLEAGGLLARVWCAAPRPATCTTMR